MNPSNTLNTADLAASLAQSGLNMCACFSTERLADSMPELKIAAQYGHLLLIGSAGTRLWEAMPKDYLTRRHPVDEYTVDCINNSLEASLGEGSWLTLFPPLSIEDSPAKTPLPLQKLGALADWHHPSPLGIGINATQGLWFAYRAAVVIDATIAIEPAVACREGAPLSSESPCLSCDAAPCLSQCPAQALTKAQNPDLTACVQHRISEDSSCGSSCLARLACPVAETFRYSEPQIEYFYQQSRAAAIRWIAPRD